MTLVHLVAIGLVAQVFLSSFFVVAATRDRAFDRETWIMSMLGGVLLPIAQAAALYWGFVVLVAVICGVALAVLFFLHLQAYRNDLIQNDDGPAI